MDLQVPLNPELEAQLREHAAASGKDVVSYVVEALREKIESQDRRDDGNELLTRDQRLRALERFIDRHRDVKAIADDSRESIYEDRL